MKEVGVRFVLTGFQEASGSRTFAFEGIAPDWTREALTVGVDLMLAQRCGVRLQELPLMCRRVLERAFSPGDALIDQPAETSSAALPEREEFTLSEDDMRAHVLANAPASNGRPRRVPRPQGAKPTGMAWRGQTV